MTWLFTPALLLALLAATPSTATAQGGLARMLLAPASTAGNPTQVFSANPVGLVMDFYNFEYELRVADAVTAGGGASHRGWYLFGEAEKPRLNGDVFVRYYPGGRAFNGLALGLKVGATRLPRDGTLPGLGFDVNHSYAVSDHVVVSTGLGMKRLFGREPRPYAGAPVVTTLRFNVGIGF